MTGLTSTALVALTVALAAIAVSLLVPPAPQLSPQLEPSHDPGRAVPGPRSTVPDRGTLARFREPVAAGSGVGAGLLVGGWVGVVLGPAVAVGVWRVVGGMESPAQRRRREVLGRGLPHVVDLLACSLSAGVSTAGAVELVAKAVDAPMRDELVAISRRLALGAEPSHVWADLGRHPQWGRLGRSLGRAVQSGASVSAAMHRLAEDLRRTSRAEVEARARGVGVRAAAPLGLCLLPAFILVGVVPMVVASASALVSF